MLKTVLCFFVVTLVMSAGGSTPAASELANQVGDMLTFRQAVEDCARAVKSQVSRQSLQYAEAEDLYAAAKLQYDTFLKAATGHGGRLWSRLQPAVAASNAAVAFLSYANQALQRKDAVAPEVPFVAFASLAAEADTNNRKAKTNTILNSVHSDLSWKTWDVINVE